ncbi:MAG: hypothetical protein PHC64_07465 [Candidatus Gastranaerophilales bacterium]|nr:hypothetical protein [Candidatus Gastranaerophilales bacterium]
MKKVVILFLIFFLSQSITFAKDGSITLDLGKNPNKVASGKLYSFILKNENFSEQKAKNDYDITENNTFADFVDLNNDGKPEIIGYNSATYFQGLTGVCLYILKADKTGNYGAISGLINFYPKDKIRISSKITNGFHDFIIDVS